MSWSPQSAYDAGFDAYAIRLKNKWERRILDCAHAMPHDLKGDEQFTLRQSFIRGWKEAKEAAGE